MCLSFFLGRYLCVFHHVWDPKAPNNFVIGSMSKPSGQVDVFGTTLAPGGGGAKGGGSGTVKKLAVLRDDLVRSHQSRLAVHPSLDVVVAANSSGRCHVFRHHGRGV